MIRLGNPAVGEAEINAVSKALRAGTLSTGEIVTEFESDCADLTGREHAAAVASGSVALELAFQASDVPEQTAVVVSPYNCAAVLFSLLRANLVPVFADIDPETFNIDSGAVEETIDEIEIPVEGLLAVHLYGKPCEMGELNDVANTHDLTLIEDFAQAPGATYDGRKVGSFGQLSIGSFGATKNLTTAEGGVVASDDEEVITRIRRIRSNTNHSTEEETLRSVRMNDLEAAIGREQIAKYDQILGRKRAAAEIYDNQLPETLATPVREKHFTHVFHGYPIRTPRRDALADFLAEREIETATVYDTPLYQYPHVETPAEPDSAFPNTEGACAEVLLLPIHGSLTQTDAEMVAGAVKEFFEGPE